MGSGPNIPNMMGPEARLKVLVVDDDQAMLKLLNEVLSSLGVQPVPVASSVKAAKLIETEKFDGIFLDLLMPEMDGFELAAKIRASSLNATVPIAVVSGSTDPKARQKAHEAGAAFFLYKPFDRKQLALLLNTTRGIMLQERRRSKRVGLMAPVSIEDGGNKGNGTISNVSEGGIAFNTPMKLEAGKKVKLTFRVPGMAEPIAPTAQILGVDANRVACQFAEIKGSEKDAIKDYVATQPELKMKASDSGKVAAMAAK